MNQELYPDLYPENDPNLVGFDYWRDLAPQSIYDPEGNLLEGRLINFPNHKKAIEALGEREGNMTFYVSKDSLRNPDDRLRFSDSLANNKGPGGFLIPDRPIITITCESSRENPDHLNLEAAVNDSRCLLVVGLDRSNFCVYNMRIQHEKTPPFEDHLWGDDEMYVSKGNHVFALNDDMARVRTVVRYVPRLNM